MIGVYKLVKAAVLLVGGLFVLRLSPNAVLEGAVRLAVRLRFDPENAWIHATIARLSGLSEASLEEIGAGFLLYGVLYTIEGVGLLLQKRWAESLVVVTTSLLIPWEVVEVIRKPNRLRIVVLLVNLAIVAYLAGTLVIERRRRQRMGPGITRADGNQESDGCGSAGPT